MWGVMSLVGCIDPVEDYPVIKKGVDYVKEKTQMFRSRGCRIEVPPSLNYVITEHRFWEYGTAVELAWRHRLLHPIQERTKVVNIGCGWDALSPALSCDGVFDITDCEPDEVCRNDRKKINEVVISMGRHPIKILPNSVYELPNESFDIVYCISVLEHVSNEGDAWLALTNRVSKDGMLFITVDCVEHKNKSYACDGARQTNYTLDVLKERIEMVKKLGFKTIGEPDYVYHGAHVFDYTFFRVGFERI